MCWVLKGDNVSYLTFIYCLQCRLTYTLLSSNYTLKRIKCTITYTLKIKQQFHPDMIIHKIKLNTSIKLTT